MNSDELCFLPLHELAGQLRTAKISSIEVTCAILDRIRTKARLHAYITVMEESALRAAAAADDEIRAGRLRGLLHGVPIAVKDLFWTKGVLTTCASGVLRDWRPRRDRDRGRSARSGGRRDRRQVEPDRICSGLVPPGLPRTAESVG